MIRKLARAIAMAIRDTFIRNVVYPSLMESSDFDGSSAAVLNYLDVIVIVLRSGHILTDVALDFLLPADIGGAEGHAYDINIPADDVDRYSMKDLILDSLENVKRPATRVAALRLARSLIVCHGFRACGGLLQLPIRRSAHIAPSTPEEDWLDEETPSNEDEEKALFTKIEMHFREIDALSSLLASFSSVTRTPASLQASLSNYLLDAEQALRLDSTCPTALDLGGGQIALERKDPFVQQLFSGLAAFFSQPVEVNLAASGVVSALAACPVRSLEGWLTHEADKGTGGEEPALLELLKGLVEQVKAYRDAVPDFDRYLAERRRSLVLTEDLSDALQVAEPNDVEGRDPQEGKQSLSACLTLPCLPSHSSGGGRLQTAERTRAAERDYGILEDKRSSLPALSPSAVTSVALPSTSTATSTASETEARPSLPTRTSALAASLAAAPPAHLLPWANPSLPFLLPPSPPLLPPPPALASPSAQE